MTTPGETTTPMGGRQTLDRDRPALSRFTPLFSKLQPQQAPEAEDVDDDLIEDGEGPKTTIVAKSLDSIQRIIPQVKVLRQMIPYYKKRVQENTRYFLARMNYKVNRFMQEPGSSAILLLFLWATAVIFGALLLRIVPAHADTTVNDALYLSWRILSDGSNHLDEYTNGPLAFFFGVLIFILGLVVTGLVIGFLTNTIVTRMETLRKGDGKIVERHHFLILGWSPKVLAIILTCCKSESAAQCIVVLADRKKELMDNDIQNSGIPKNTRIRIITKEGDPGNPQVLNDVSVALARCTIILADASLSDQVDTTTILRAVVVLGVPKLQGFIVAEMTEKDKINTIAKIGGSKVVPLFPADFVGRLICECGRQPGLAGVFSYLLDFVGSDFYLKDCPPHLVGKTFNEVAFYLSDGSTLCGVLKNTKIDEDDKEKYRFVSDALLINPSNDHVIQPGDQLLVLSEEFATASFLASPRSFDYSKIVMPTNFKPPADSIKQFLIIGWRANMSKIVSELGEYLPEGSTVTILSDRPTEERSIDTPSQIRVEHVVGNPLLPDTLNPHVKREDPYTAIFVLSDRSATANDHDTERSDNRSVVVSLLLTEMLAQGTPLRKSSLMEVEVSGELCTHVPGIDMPLIVTEINDVSKMSLISH